MEVVEAHENVLVEVVEAHGDDEELLHRIHNSFQQMNRNCYSAGKKPKLSPAEETELRPNNREKITQFLNFIYKTPCFIFDEVRIF